MPVAVCGIQFADAVMCRLGRVLRKDHGQADDIFVLRVYRTGANTALEDNAVALVD